MLKQGPARRRPRFGREWSSFPRLDLQGRPVSSGRVVTQPYGDKRRQEAEARRDAAERAMRHRKVEGKSAELASNDMGLSQRIDILATAKGPNAVQRDVLSP